MDNALRGPIIATDLESKVGQTWNFDTALKATRHRNIMKVPSNGFAILAEFGATIYAYNLAKIGFTAVLASSSLTTLGITVIAAGVFAYLLGKYSSRAMVGLTHEKIVDLSVKQLNSILENLTVFRAGEYPEDVTTIRQHTNYVIGLITRVNQLHCLVSSLSQLTLQPRVGIYGTDLSMEQRLALLKTAYAKGIVLEFYEFFHGNFMDKTLPSYSTEVERDYGSTTAEKMKLAFECSVNFLENCLQNRDENFDVEGVNDQLNALGFKWPTPQGYKILKPAIYLESESSLVIKGNCNELPNPINQSLEKLAPYVHEIKIHRAGITSSFLHSDKSWNSFQDNLQELFPGNSIVFIEDAEENDSIWQTIPWNRSLVDYQASILNLF